MSGKLVVIEGIDGAGKSELIKRLMETHGKSALFTHEPWDRSLAEEYKHKSPEEQAYYFAMDRFRHLKHVVIPALNEGLNVICDRYVYSNYAYQSYADVPILFINMIQPTNFVESDFVIHLDCDPEIAAIRSGETDIKRLEIIQYKYHDIYSYMHGLRVFRINTTCRTADDVYRIALKELKQLGLLL